MEDMVQQHSAPSKRAGERIQKDDRKVRLACGMAYCSCL